MTIKPDPATAKEDMTWGEFKEFVEGQGVTDDDEIDYIDMHPQNGVPVDWDTAPSGKRMFYILSSDD